MDSEALIRDQLVKRLRGRGAHMPFEEAVADFPMDRINEKPPGGEYSAWALLEHIRLAQLDILEYCTDPNYEHRPHPEGFWPTPDAVAEPADWRETCELFQGDLDALIRIVEKPETDLYAPIPWGGEHTILREILIITDHNAFHLGEFAFMRQVMGAWPAGRG